MTNALGLMKLYQSLFTVYLLTFILNLKEQNQEHKLFMR